jgi:hypothetical protein
MSEGDFPVRGDNFVTRGPWYILEGTAWHDWQEAALAATLAAAGWEDPLVGSRLEARLAAHRRRKPKTPALGPVPTRLPD